MKIKLNNKLLFNSKIKFSFVIYLFFFIFAPPIIPIINSIFILFIYSLFKIIFFHKKEIKEILLYSKIKQYIKKMIIAYFYILIIMSIFIFADFVGVKNYILTIYRFILLIPVTITCIAYILIVCKRNSYSFNQLLEGIVYAGVLQGIIALTMYLFPNFRNLIIQIMYQNTGSSILVNEWYLQRRCYAFSNSIVDSFGYGTGLIAGICIIYTYFENVKLVKYLPLLLLTIILNSRTGLVILLVFLFFIGILLLKKFLLKLSVKSMFIIITSLFILILFMNYLKETKSYNAMWVLEGIEEIINLIFGNTTALNGSVGFLLSDDFWQLPNIFNFIVGTGHNLYGAVGYAHSDVGYINDIWLGGVIGMTLLYTPLLNLCSYVYRNHDGLFAKIISLSMFFSFLIANIKGYMINYNAGMAVTLLVLFGKIFDLRLNMNEAKK